MCILTFVKPGITPDVDALRNGARANPHGHGYALITGETITVGHGMDATAVIAEFAAVRDQYPHGAALFHSRLATHGPRNLDNCHPFHLGRDQRTVLAHNGILPTTMHPRPGDPRSDTRIAAEDYLPTQPFGSLDSWAGRDRLERWLRGDKMVILTVDPAYKHRAYIFNEHHGCWDDGSWYSNYGYRPYLWADAAEEYCDNCGEPDDRLGPHCPGCGFCTECSRAFPKCFCPSLDGEERYADLLELEYT
ncbi:class II glutamine amidotransferase [Nocardia sp. NPDC050793]|uniref:class II glutamine amidotransferase n=1 Tax=Nocardia sp. NPDC050793 TaxID=3155159 RepID=UPI0033EEDD40